MAKKIILLLLSLFLLTGICTAAKGVMVDGQEIKRIGGWPAKSEEHVRATFHEDIEYVYLMTIGDMMEALRQKKIDAIAMSSVFYNALRASGEDEIAVLGDPIGKTSYAFVFAYSEHGDRLRRLRIESEGTVTPVSGMIPLFTGTVTSGSSLSRR